MRTAIPTALALVGMALTSCAAPAGTNSASPSLVPTPTAATSPNPAATPLTFPAHAPNELVRAEFRNGEVSGGQSHPLTRAGSYVVRAACSGTGADFAYAITINDHESSSGSFACGHETTNTVGNLSAGDRVHITLTKVVAPFEGWAVVVPDPVG